MKKVKFEKKQKENKMRYTLRFISILIAFFVFGLSACAQKDDLKYETETLAIKSIVAADSFTILRYEWHSGMIQFWGHTTEEHANLETVGKTSDAYKELMFQIDHDFFAKAKNLQSISFTVEAERDCDMSFTISNSCFKAESLNNPIKTGEAKNITIDVDRPISEIFAETRFGNKDDCLNIGTYSLIAIEPSPDQPVNYYREIDKVLYTCKPSAPEVKIKILDITLLIDVEKA